MSLEQIDSEIAEHTLAIAAKREGQDEWKRRRRDLTDIEHHERELDSLRAERDRLLRLEREADVSELKPARDELVRRHRDDVLRASESARALDQYDERARLVNGGRHPWPRQHLLALLPGGRASATPFDSWHREVERYLEALKPRRVRAKRVNGK